MEITNTQVFGFESSIRSQRNPMNSWGKSDSMSDTLNLTGAMVDEHSENYNIERFVLGEADSILSQKLTKAGTEHCKHLRMIQVWFDLDAPRYLWAELDTYRFLEKVSCSTMHKLFERELTLDDFEGGQYNRYFLNGAITGLGAIRNEWLETDDKTKALIQAKTILPESFLQKRTVTTNYQQLLNIYYQRRYHKLPQWKIVCDWILNLPYFKELTGVVE